MVDLVHSPGLVDAVFRNACFDDFYDPQEALQAISALFYYGGRLVISHPTGREFVRRLKDEQPEMVTLELPEQAHLEAMLATVGFRLELFQYQRELCFAVTERLTDAVPPNTEFYADISPFVAGSCL